MHKEKAYAKINLFLNVISKRDDGFHNLEMVMAPLDFYDTITFKTEDKNITLSSDVYITETVEENLVYKIAVYLKEKYEISNGVSIKIVKRIPMGAGLAGGSADAAATLRGLNKLWDLKLSLSELSEIGEKFGADIPFCVYNKLCMAKGKGEDLYFFDQKLKSSVLLVNPNIHISTKRVFSNLKKEDIVKRKIEIMANGIYNKNNEVVINELFNSLEKSVFTLEPTIGRIKKQMSDWGIRGVLMSGSGSTVFALSQDRKRLADIQRIFADSYFVKLTKLL
jgi:4-diphosphocytidyl-2-C-methyl-D-erythritol kinase